MSYVYCFILCITLWSACLVQKSPALLCVARLQSTKVNLCESKLHVFVFFLSVDTPINNERYTSLRFHVKESYVLHGFAGYFDTVLYDDFTLSMLAWV